MALRNPSPEVAGPILTKPHRVTSIRSQSMLPSKAFAFFESAGSSDEGPGRYCILWAIIGVDHSALSGDLRFSDVFFLGGCESSAGYVIVVPRTFAKGVRV